MAQGSGPSCDCNLRRTSRRCPMSGRPFLHTASVHKLDASPGSRLSRWVLLRRLRRQCVAEHLRGRRRSRAKGDFAGERIYDLMFNRCNSGTRVISVSGVMCLTFETDNSVEWERTSGGIIHLVSSACATRPPPRTRLRHSLCVRPAVRKLKVYSEWWTQLGARVHTCCSRTVVSLPH